MANLIMYDICRVPYYKISDPLFRGSMMLEYGYQASRGSTGNPTPVQYGTLGGANDFYGSGGLLAPNGKIYAPPNDQNAINNQALIIDPKTNITSTIAGIGGAGPKWSPGALAANGKMYFFPISGTTSILSIDPTTNALSTFGSVTAGYGGAVLAPNGKIYAIPMTAGLPVAVFDPSTNQFTSISGATTGGWIGGVLALTGKIYAFPMGNIAAVGFLEIDPTNDSVSTFASFAGTQGFFGGGMAPDGRFYSLPVGNHQSMVFDPFARTVSYFGTTYPLNQFEGNVVGPNGITYGSPRGSATIDTLSMGPVVATGISAGGATAQTSGILVPTGRIYTIPRSASVPFQYLQTNARGTLCENILMSPFFNKF
ncbi:MAG TPA: hypothetical protein PKN93_10125 [Leptospiraceae bacterium]|nr:hypothetical protein [Leptospiraceae bacterium]HNN75000.1 hypothetical protein [Leptospiraceae bacterium]